MDDLDEKLITLLRHNGRRSISDIAIDLGVSRATVRARMERLENSGDIIGYTVILRSDAVDLPVRGIMMIEIEGHVADRVVKALGGFSEISAIHTTNGRFDLVVELVLPRSPISTLSCAASGWCRASRPAKPICCWPHRARHVQGFDNKTRHFRRVLYSRDQASTG